MATFIWAAMAILLFACSVIEAYILLHDHGTVSRLIDAARNMAAAAGWPSVVKPAVSMIFGKVRDAIQIQRIDSYKDETAHIAFCPIGGLGDYIISAKVFEELQAAGYCAIDVFCEKMSFGESIYGGRKNVRILPYNKFERTRTKYDLALMVEHFVHVKNKNAKRLRRLAPVIAEKAEYIEENWNRLYVDIAQDCYRGSVQFERCRILGLNRWTELRMGEAFEIANDKVYIPMDGKFEKRWKKYGFIPQTYLTINYGADVIKAGKRQLKIWPKEHYEKLIDLLHGNYSYLKIIQLGAADAEKINNCDAYILGESMEMVKWILKDSLCHIDCEGGLVHLATQLNTKCVVIFGPTSLSMYGYKSNINLQSEECHNCMGLHEDWAYECFRKEAPPLCMSHISADRVFEAMEKGGVFNVYSANQN